MKINNIEVQGACHSLGSFVMDSDIAVVTDPCYVLGTWCQTQIENVQQGTWQGYVYRKASKLDSMLREKHIAETKATLEKTKERASKLPFDGDFFIQEFERALKEATEADWSRVTVLVTHHESIDPFTGFHNEWRVSEADIGVDSGQMSIAPLSSWKVKEQCLNYEGEETVDPDYPEHKRRGHSGPYWKICDINGSSLGGGIYDNRAAVSQSGYGDGSYLTFTLTNNNKVCGIAVVFISDREDDNEDE